MGMDPAKRSLVIVGIITSAILLLGCVEYPMAEVELEGEWYQLESMPLALSELSSAKGDGKVYLGGGFEPEGVTSEVFMVFDLYERSFKELERLPIGLHHTSLAYLDGRVYMAGGWEDLDFDATDYFYAYDIEEEEWLQKEDMPHKRAAHRIIAYDDRILVFGGVGESTQDVLEYNPEDKTWEVIAELPRDREHHTVELFNDMIYLVSGRWNGQNIASIDVYDPNEKSFETIMIEKGVSGHASAIIGDKLHIIGGEHLREIRAYDTHQVVDLNTLEAYITTPFPTRRHGHRAHSHNSSILTFGGAIGAEYNTFKTTTSMVHEWKTD